MSDGLLRGEPPKKGTLVWDGETDDQRTPTELAPAL